MPLIDTEPPDSSLRSAFNACAIAALGNREKASSLNLANVSLREHTLALAKTHAALGNPVTANSDATLATVLLLCLYEVCQLTLARFARPTANGWLTEHYGDQRVSHVSMAFTY